jgi:transposase-like protein
MSKAAIQNPAYTNEDAAREALEAVRWPDGPYCPHCGNLDQEKIAKGAGKAHRHGLYYCAACNGQFTVTVGTVMERSKIPLSKWLMAMHLIGSSKKGMSAHQMHRMLGVTYKSAWFMCHRIREAMKDDKPTPLGGEGKSVQADETYIGNSSKRAKGYKKGHRYKQQIVALVEPKGKARVVHVKSATSQNITEILRANVDRASELHTDESALYRKVGKEFAAHKTVEHGVNQHGYYVGEEGQTTNAAENFFGIFKRGMVGTYHKCEAQHLQRYLTEFEFRHNNRSGLGVTDGERVALIAKGIGGKRLTYRPTNGNSGQSAVH